MIILNHLFGLTLLFLAVVQFKSFYQYSECVQEFQKQSIQLHTQNLLKASNHYPEKFYICHRQAFFRENSYEQKSNFPSTNQAIAWRISSKLKRE